jgi:DNA-binding beta-propeller fold protein YncE
MKPYCYRPVLSLLIFSLAWVTPAFTNTAAAPKPAVAAAALSPTAVAVSADGGQLFIACATANRLVVFDTATAQVVRTIPLPLAPSGLVLTRDNSRLVVSGGGDKGALCLVEVATGKIVRTLRTGHTPMSPVLTPDERRVLVCYRFENCIGIIDLLSGKESARIPVAREPVAAALTQDGTQLVVANHLHNGRADADRVAACVSIIDVAQGRVVKELVLPNGSSQLRDVRVSPDGRWACVTHLLSRYHLPTTQLERGWMNSNAMSLIDLAKMEVLNTILLDSVDRGAANPWGAAWTADSRTLCVTHAGTHELSVINVPLLIQKLQQLPVEAPTGAAYNSNSASRTVADVPTDLAFLVGIGQRIPLSGRGPRALAITGTQVYVADYFSDTLDRIELSAQPLKAKAIALQPEPPVSVVRRGEALFNDATLCFQGWQSCASCHSADARVDGLNWDLLNDGIGNPKNSKSLLLSHQTPPAMSMSVRETAEDAVRAGLRHILFTVQPEEISVALDEYLKSLKPIPSPFLVKGRLSPSARRGKALFLKPDTGCASCHPPGLFTDLNHHDVGTLGQFDRSGDQFDTPTLVEIWRTAPYLHDGSAVTLRELFTTRNAQDQHGRTASLTPGQVDDLVAYLLSL